MLKSVRILESKLSVVLAKRQAVRDRKGNAVATERILDRVRPFAIQLQGRNDHTGRHRRTSVVQLRLFGCESSIHAMCSRCGTGLVHAPKATRLGLVTRLLEVSEKSCHKAAPRSVVWP